ncbi:MAG: class I SAM-dependent methyltransferase [Turicibacter sp.]|nr:class I SAM-dependent methyltransferase [Turicibacter sp.]
MKNVPYGAWCSYVDKIFKKFDVCGDVLDLACGTGTMAYKMAKKGYNIIGVDNSADMLSEANFKKYKLGADSGLIMLIKQDMLKLDLYGTVAAAYSTCDTLNYLLTEEDFLAALKNVALFLEMGGVFIFDLKTEETFRDIGNKMYKDTLDDGGSYEWKNEYKNGINTYMLNFTTKENGTFAEIHHQRPYRLDVVLQLLKEANFTAYATDNYTDSPPTKESRRITYVCERVGNFT